MAAQPRRLLLLGASLSSLASEAPLVPSSSLNAMVAGQPGEVAERGRGVGGGPAELAAAAPPPAAAASVKRPMGRAQGARRRQPGRSRGEERAPPASTPRAPPRPRERARRGTRPPARSAREAPRVGFRGSRGKPVRLAPGGTSAREDAPLSCTWRRALASALSPDTRNSPHFPRWLLRAGTGAGISPPDAFLRVLGEVCPLHPVSLVLACGAWVAETQDLANLCGFHGARVLGAFIEMRGIMDVRGSWRKEDRHVKIPKEKSLDRYRQSTDIGLTRTLFHRKNSNPLFSTLYLFP